MSHTITVGQEAADIVGSDNSALQRAVDSIAARGGGMVEIGPGTYQMHDSLHLRSNVTVRGAGSQTILRKAPVVSSPLSADLGYGHFDVSLAEPEKFRVGMGVYIADDIAGGFYTTVATLIWRDGDRFGIDRMLNHDYTRSKNAAVKSLFPIVSGYHLQNAAIENLTIDGNRNANERLNGCRGGGVFLYQASNLTMRDLEIYDYHGEGISFQQTQDVLIEDCVCRDNLGNGLHPGSGSVRSVMRRVKSRNNLHDGVFYCLRVSYSLLEECTLENNGGSGISVNGRDTDHLIRRNTIRHNAKAGIRFWPGDEPMGGHRCQLEANSFDSNCTQEGEGEIVVPGQTTDIHIVGNRFHISGSAHPAIVITEQAKRIVVYGNEVTPPTAKLLDNRSALDAVSTKSPAEPLPVGPQAAPSLVGRHLSGV